MYICIYAYVYMHMYICIYMYMCIYNSAHVWVCWRDTPRMSGCVDMGGLSHMRVVGALACG